MKMKTYQMENCQSFVYINTYSYEKNAGPNVVMDVDNFHY